MYQNVQTLLEKCTFLEVALKSSFRGVVVKYFYIHLLLIIVIIACKKTLPRETLDPTFYYIIIVEAQV